MFNLNNAFLFDLSQVQLGGLVHEARYLSYDECICEVAGMLDFKQSPGEHAFFFQGEVGRVEAILTIPHTIARPMVALLGHPHSLQGGTMDNKVVTTMARVFKELHIPSIRFNFRGVGRSEGAYDAGIGEAEDMRRLALDCQAQWPAVQLIFAGFSFGAYVTYRAALTCSPRLLISIAPPVHHYHFLEPTSTPHPWVVVQGQEDEVVPYRAVENFVAQVSPAITLISFADTGHFFHGKLVMLKEALLNAIEAQHL